MAALLVAMGSCIRGTLVLTLGLPIALAGLAFTAHAVRLLQLRPEGSRDSRAAVVGALLLASAIGLGAPSVGGPVYDACKRGYFLAAGVAVWAWAYGNPRYRQGIVVALCVAYCALQIATPLVLPDPFIDSWAWTQSCLRALAQGIHPYTVQPADILHGDFYRLGSAPRYPYMPATLLIYFPAYAAFGDYRFLSAACGPLTLWMVRSVARHLRVSNAVSDIALLTIVLHPRSFTMVGFGWTEPLLAAVLVAFVLLSLRRPGGVSQRIAVLLLPSLKQYALVPALWFVWTRALQTRRASVCALAVVVAMAAPFLYWDATATIAGITSELSSATTPSLRSTSLVASFFAITGEFPSRWLAAIVQLAVGVYAYNRLRHVGLGGLLLGSALALLATFLTAWQAFVNYFYFVTVCLTLAALVLSAQDEHGRPQIRIDY